MDFQIKQKTLLGILVFFQVILLSCDLTTPENRRISLGVRNHSGKHIARTTLFIQDGEINNNVETGAIKEVMTFYEIESGISTELETINISQYSNSGEGFFTAEVVFSSGDTLRNGIGVYKRNRIYTENLPKSYQTMIIDVDSNYGIIGRTEK
ncbi:MAG: hypothetical protein KF870_03740 [Leadbetterella sp.]|nr:hypothetical protein [Leadbetterella sp.]